MVVICILLLFVMCPLQVILAGELQKLTFEKQWAG